MRVSIWRTAPCALAFLVLASGADAQIDRAPPFPMDTPMTMRAIEAVCTGIGADARADPRWPSFPLRVEVVGPGGEFLGRVLVTVMKEDEALAAINCNGPWVLFRLPPGAYGVTAEFEGMMRSGRVTVAATGQARVILRFP